jgi:hypothetical protein
VNDLEVPLQPGGRIRGRVLLDGEPPLPSADTLNRILMLVYPADARQVSLSIVGIPAGGVDPDGRFATIGLPPGRYVLDPYARVDNRMYAMTSVQVAGREVFDIGLDLGPTHLNDVVVTLTSRTWEVSGAVRDQDARPVPGARVILFPQDRARWQTAGYSTPRRVMHVAADRTGAFRATGVLADTYLLAAVTNPPEFWMAPEYLESLVPIATPVRLELGQTQSVDLRLR